MNKKHLTVTNLQVIMLALLLSLQVQSRQPSQVLLAHGLVDGGAAADALAVVVRRVGPPVRLHFDVAQDHVLYRSGEPGYLKDGLRYFSILDITKLCTDIMLFE